jgi:hypothetical protein
LYDLRQRRVLNVARNRESIVSAFIGQILASGGKKMGKNIAVNSAAKIAMDKVSGAAKDQLMKEVMSDTIKGEAAKDAGLKTVKSVFGYAMLFVNFVDTYSKAVKQANLEIVRRDLEVCPHIGGCENQIHAQTIACNTKATVWSAPDGYWYFHPQLNYRVRHARQIFRTTESGGWRIEWPGKSEWVLQDCLACVEAHCGG